MAKADYDLVIRGGRIADGLGSPLFDADVAVQDGRIAAVGSIAGTGREEIDASGAIVAPGVVDIHTHYDGQAVWDAQLASSSWHGVTTVVMGNCGVGFAPVRVQDRDRLVELMEGVEDIPGVALREGLDWRWESFADYLDAVERRSHDMDICAQLPHGALRVYVMGERAARLEAATPDDIERMRKLTIDAMRAGAIGFSTSRSINHRTIKGDPTPSLRATEDELTAIAMALREAGHGVFQLLSDFDMPSMEEEFAMMRRIVAKSGRPMSFAVIQKHDDPEGWRKLLKLIDGAVKDGLPMMGQVAPRPVGMLLGLQATLNPFTRSETYGAIADKSLEQRVAIMRDPAFRARLIREMDGRKRSRLDLNLVFPLGDPPDYEPHPDTSVAAQSQRLGKSPNEVAYDLMLADEGRAFLYAPAANYRYGDLQVCREMMADPNTVIALGDGGAHVGTICDSSIPTFLMTHWAEECGRKDGFGLSWLIKRQTSDAARSVGLMDRGVVAAGMKADLNVIDLGKLRLSPPRMEFDLPAGGKRLLQKASGYRVTVKSGVITYRDGEHTGALPGKLVRGPQAAA
ncbi:amidohydrolase family protein [Reyranella sp. CPCC 100927]|uniref:N-acyl-D-amino-acid deacylase family protein n=1 Tax=Reyranella sp. CPCC 100927 TaxID=2599616 RepID=UPI0011B767FC|nr:amidohydrolase family protein [Reyranella sp. CPCC 100927]TWT00688.1 amidohydrolase family protein [Reyranella sp. CPCC 100927]